MPKFIEDMNVGSILPRSEDLVVETFIELMKTHSALTVIRDDIRYENLLKKLEI